MTARTALIAAAVAAVVAAVAHAELVFDPNAAKGASPVTSVRAVSSSDAAVMAWVSGEPFKGAQVFAARSAGDQTWGNPAQVSGAYPDWVLADGGAGEFSLVRAASGAYLLAWSAATQWRAQVGAAHGSADSGLAYLAQGPDIWVAASSDGRTWGAPQAVALAPTPDRSPGIIEMPDGRVGVIWVSYRDGNTDLSLAFAGPDGNWGQAIQITSDPARDDQYELVHVGPKYTTDSRGRLTLAWVSDRSGAPEAWTAVSADGRTWSHLVQVSSTPGDKGFLTIEEAPIALESPTGTGQAEPGYNLYWSEVTSEGEQRWVSQSRDFVTWSTPKLAPVGK
jgi:hypothetical protein